MKSHLRYHCVGTMKRRTATRNCAKDVHRQGRFSVTVVSYHLRHVCPASVTVHDRTVLAVAVSGTWNVLVGPADPGRRPGEDR